MKREMERKEQERKNSLKVEFVGGGTQTGIVAAAPKINIPLPGKKFAFVVNKLNENRTEEIFICSPSIYCSFFNWWWCHI